MIGKYLKMADVFDATCSVPVFTDDEMYCGDSFVAEFNSRGSALLAAHAINTHDELVVINQDLLAALEAAVECGMVPTSSATEGGAMRYVKQAHVADQIRAAIAKAKGSAS